MNDSLSRNDIHRLLPAMANVKFSDGCHKSEGRATWRSIVKAKGFKVYFDEFFRHSHWVNDCHVH